MDARSFGLAVLAVCVLSAAGPVRGSAAGQGPVPEAGPDVTAVAGVAVRLQGTVSGRAPLEWWTADGNDGTEDMLVRFHSNRRPTATGPLREASGVVWDWPGDLVVVRGRVFGADSGKRRLFELDPETGLVTPIGPATDWSLFALAHDRMHDRLFGVDPGKGQLLSLDRTNGVARPVGTATLARWSRVHSLAYDLFGGVLWAVDQKTGDLLAIDPNDGAVRVAARLDPAPGPVDELDFHAGLLYAVRAVPGPDGAMVGGQLQRLDPRTGDAEDVGPVLPGVSPHCLVVRSVPELCEWSVRSGPGSVDFLDRRTPGAIATFEVPGTYVLTLHVLTRAGPVTDSVTVTVRAP